MAFKNKPNTKGMGKDPSLSQLGQRMISTMLREERLAERDLQEKLKAITAKEHKTMVKLGCDSLDVRHDLSLQRSSSPVPGEPRDAEGVKRGKDYPTDAGSESRPNLLGRRAVSMLTYSSKHEGVDTTDYRSPSEELTPCSQSPRIRIEKHNGNNPDNRSSSPSSPRLLRRRPVSDITSTSVNESSSVEKISALGIVEAAPSTPPPVRRNQTTLSSSGGKPRPSSARMSRSKQPTVRGREEQRLGLPSRGRSPSPSRLSPDSTQMNLGRRGSGPCRINVNTLPSSSPLRVAAGSQSDGGNLRPVSHDALRRRRSANEEDLQDRVEGFLKSLQKN